MNLIKFSLRENVMIIDLLENKKKKQNQINFHKIRFLDLLKNKTKCKTPENHIKCT
jgi:hypothetical protein